MASFFHLTFKAPLEYRKVPRQHCKATVNRLFKQQVHSTPKWHLVEPRARFLSATELDACSNDGRFSGESLSFGVIFSPSLFSERLGSSTVQHITFLKEFADELRHHLQIQAVIGPMMITSDPLALNISLGERDLLV